MFKLILGPHALWGGLRVSRSQEKMFSSTFLVSNNPVSLLWVGTSPGPCLIVTAIWVIRNLSRLTVRAVGKSLPGSSRVLPQGQHSHHSLYSRPPLLSVSLCTSQSRGLSSQGWPYAASFLGCSGGSHHPGLLKGAKDLL